MEIKKHRFQRVEVLNAAYNVCELHGFDTVSGELQKEREARGESYKSSR